jgi:hypothetical protein
MTTNLIRIQYLRREDLNSVLHDPEANEEGFYVYWYDLEPDGVEVIWCGPYEGYDEALTIKRFVRNDPPTLQDWIDRSLSTPPNEELLDTRDDCRETWYDGPAEWFGLPNRNW